ncbi:unnamed protein product [Urochloa humidicola]
MVQRYRSSDLYWSTKSNMISATSGFQVQQHKITLEKLEKYPSGTHERLVSCGKISLRYLGASIFVEGPPAAAGGARTDSYALGEGRPLGLRVGRRCRRGCAREGASCGGGLSPAVEPTGRSRVAACS